MEGRMMWVLGIYSYDLASGLLFECVGFELAVIYSSSKIIWDVVDLVYFP